MSHPMAPALSVKYHILFFGHGCRRLKIGWLVLQMIASLWTVRLLRTPLQERSGQADAVETRLDNLYRH